MLLDTNAQEEGFMKRFILATAAVIAVLGAFVMTVTVQDEVPAMGVYDGVESSIELEVNPAHAEDYHECMAKGCSSKDCQAATQNGYTCKTWTCFKKCLRGKGFTKGCYDYLPDQAKMEACKKAGDECESKCKYG